MDLVSIAVSAGLSALLFIVLEFSIILPLFTKIVRKACGDMVESHLLPSVTAYINDQIALMKTDLSDAVFTRIRAMIGGRKKGVNSILNRLADGETLEDIEDEYQQSTIDQVLSIVSAVADRLPRPSGENHDEKKNSTQGGGSSPSLLPLGSSQEDQA